MLEKPRGSPYRAVAKFAHVEFWTSGLMASLAPRSLNRDCALGPKLPKGADRHVHANQGIAEVEGAIAEHA